MSKVTVTVTLFKVMAEMTIELTAGGTIDRVGETEKKKQKFSKISGNIRVR